MFSVVGTVGSMKVDVARMSVSVGAANSSGVGTVQKSGAEGVGAVQFDCVGADGVVGRVCAGGVIVGEVGREGSL